MLNDKEMGTQNPPAADLPVAGSADHGDKQATTTQVPEQGPSQQDASLRNPSQQGVSQQEASEQQAPERELPVTDDGDSSYEDSTDTSSYSASLLSEMKEYKYENGRRYHTYREGEYVLPNDENEQDRQDLLHHVRNLVLKGSLYLAPIPENPHRVLDIGTGTGIWAIDFADQQPSAEVIGTDLSPIQPAWVPPNLFFQVEDAEAEWLFSRGNPFDFIHMRDLGGSISDWSKIVKQSYDHLKPSGWIELQEFEVTLKSDDDTMQLAPNLLEYLKHLHEASAIFKKPMNIAEGHKQRLIDAGFRNVKSEVFKVPSSGWHHDPLQKEIGRYNLCSLLMAVESYALALFTRVLGWSNEATQVLLMGVRSDLKNRKVHSYCNLHIVYGQKPESTTGSGD